MPYGSLNEEKNIPSTEEADMPLMDIGVGLGGSGSFFGCFSELDPKIPKDHPTGFQKVPMVCKYIWLSGSSRKVWLVPTTL